MGLCEQDGITAQAKGENIIGSESPGSHVIAEIVQETELQIRDSGEKRAEHPTGHGDPIVPPGTSTIVRWIALNGKRGKTLRSYCGNQKKEQKRRHDPQNKPSRTEKTHTLQAPSHVQHTREMAGIPAFLLRQNRVWETAFSRANHKK
jgi:hypothetical protein